MSQRFPFGYPFGWFHVAYSHELAAGSSRAIHFFGQDMVLFRTDSGRACVLDAYCIHLGAHLGHGIHGHRDQGGEIRGDTIVCPFHGWRYDGDGYCVEVPYAKNMPPKLKDKPCLKAWPVSEKNGIVWLWYHPRGEAPLWQVADIPEANSSEWSEMDIHRWAIRTHTQEMAENGSDPVHFRYVHGTADVPDPQYMKYTGHEYKAETFNVLDTPKGQVTSVFSIYNNGPGQAVSTFSGLCDTLLQACVTPIDEELVAVNFAFQQKRDAEAAKTNLGKALIADICRQVDEDRVIWEHKKYQEKPILCDGDGPIAKFRKWYSQFYAD